MYKESFSEDEMWKLVNILPTDSGVDAVAAAPDLQRLKSDNIPIKKWNGTRSLPLPPVGQIHLCR